MRFLFDFTFYPHRVQRGGSLKALKRDALLTAKTSIKPHQTEDFWHDQGRENRIVQVPKVYDVYDVGMVRKQLYLEETQDKALKARAKELGISEAELVRRALDAALRLKGSSHLTAPRRAALTQLLDNAKRISKGHHLPEGYRFNRDELYDEREGRWLKRH